MQSKRIRPWSDPDPVWEGDRGRCDYSWKIELKVRPGVLDFVPTWYVDADSIQDLHDIIPNLVSRNLFRMNRSDVLQVRVRRLT